MAESCRFLIQPWYYLDFLISPNPRLTGAEIDLPQVTFAKRHDVMEDETLLWKTSNHGQRQIVSL